MTERISDERLDEIAFNEWAPPFEVHDLIAELRAWKFYGDEVK